ncbi:MAG: penicillin-binding protein 2 [Actinobacteria bacterium]|nr:penicillin-binding protein 2 [Actinomycetota bacterium]
MGERRKKRAKSTSGSGRFIFLWVAVTLALLAISARLVELHVIEAPAFAKLAEEQRTRDLELLPRRGTIFDREGEPLAISVEARSIYASPRFVKDPAATAKSLSTILGGNAAEYEEKLRRDAGFVYIARKVDIERANALKELDLAGIGFLDDSRRVYPFGELAAQVLGFVGVDNIGLTGIEKQYDDVLAGTPGRIIAERDPSGRPIPGGVSHTELPVDGEDIQLTIDKDIQHKAQMVLAETVKSSGAIGGNVIVMDANDGSIYAMASYPGFDPNNFRSADQSAVRNRALTDVYEPGSTLKALTVAAAIDRGLFTPESVFDLPATIQIGGRTIGEARRREFARMDLTEILAFSSNVGSVKLGMAMGPETLYDYFDRFGLNEAPGIDFPGQSRGVLIPVDQWSPSTLGTLTYGQGISLTPMQLARAMCAIANGGTLPAPHLLSSADGAQTTGPRAISESTSATMREMLVSAVTSGTGSAAAMPGYSVAGKTGTALKIKEDGSGYAKGKYIASFAGFLPAGDPQVVILVNIDEPGGNAFGGVVAAPAFRRIAEFVVSHIGISPQPERQIDDTTTVGADVL